MPYWGNGAPPACLRLGGWTGPFCLRLTSSYVQLMSLKVPRIFEFLTLVRSLTVPPRMFATRACGTAVPVFMLKLFRVCIPAEPLSDAY
jgi:hypothetical protein